MNKFNDFEYDVCKIYKKMNNYDEIKDDKNKEYIGRLLNIEPNDITLIFFNDDNINFLNKQIQNEVLKLSKDEIGRSILIEEQQKEKMITIMRYIYFTHSTNTMETMDEVNYLNNEFLKLVVPIAFSSLNSHIRYLNTYDRSKRVPLDNPINTKKEEDSSVRLFTRNFF